MSLGLSGVFGFTQIRPGGHWVHTGSLGSLGFALGADGFIRSRWVHWRSPWGSLDSLAFALGVVGCTQIRPECCWVHAASSGSLGFALGVVGFIRDRWVPSGSPWV